MSDEGWRDQAAILAQELRASSQALIEREIAGDALARATELARELGRCLDGPTRSRWYDLNSASPMDAPAREVYGDQSPLRGRLNPIAPPLRTSVITRDDGSRAIEGLARLGVLYEGPPHGVHGGFVAALFDEILGAVMGLVPPVGVTAKLEVRYRHITPLDEELRFEGWLEEDRGRRLTVRATCHAGETLTADARGLFVRVDFDEVQERMLERRED